MMRLTGAPVLAEILLGAASAAALQEGSAAPDALARLSGTYQSAAPEPWYSGSGIREFVFRDGQWSLTFNHALDPTMTMRTFQFRTGGAYAVGEPTDDIEGACRTVFEEGWKRLTLLTADPGIAAGMGLAGRALTVNLEADISETGCAAWPPVAECGQPRPARDGSGQGRLRLAPCRQ